MRLLLSLLLAAATLSTPLCANDNTATTERHTSTQLGISPLPAANEIWYTAAGKVEPSGNKSFRASITSHSYDAETGQGVICFNTKLERLCDNAFYKNTLITSVTLPNSVTEIGEAAFKGCERLESVTLGGNIEELGTDAFNSCSNLRAFYGNMASADGRCLVADNTILAFAPAGIKEYTIAEGITSIGYHAFRDCSSLLVVRIPKSLTSISTEAFHGCTSLRCVHISDIAAWCKMSLSYYSNPLSNGAYLYLNGTLVTNLVLPSSVSEISSYAFNGCKSIKSVTLHQGVSEIGSCAFSGCVSLVEVTLPNSVTIIGDTAFDGCVMLERVTLSDSLIKLGVASFKDCKSLRSIAIPKSLKVVDWRTFWGCTSLEEVTLHEGITTLEVAAFRDCSALRSITLPESLTTIKDWAFRGCKELQSITLPQSTKELGEQVFGECYALKVVYCKPTTPPNAGNNLFRSHVEDEYIDLGCPIVVPSEALDSYTSANGWSDYAAYIVSSN